MTADQGQRADSPVVGEVGSSPTQGEEVRVWHDPLDATLEVRTCPDCDNNPPWPCAERHRQRGEMERLRAYLDSALYTITPGQPRPRIDGREAVRYSSPLDWWADMTYGEHGVLMVVHTPTGDVRSEHATVAWLDGVLP